MSRRARAALFVAPAFPTIDAPEFHRETYQALGSMPVEIAGTPRDLSTLLDSDACRVLVLPYGSAFPLDAWPAILAFVRRGGGLVVFGGAPFHQPVRRGAHVGPAPEWILGPRQPTYARELLIGPAERCQREKERGWSTRLVPDTGWTQAFPEATTTWSLTVRLATRRDTPQDDGSAGPRDAVLRPLVHIVDEAGLVRGCPLLEIDRLRGDEAGARWIFAPCDAKLTATVIRAAVSRALDGARELEARPVQAAIDPGEAAVLRVTHRRPYPLDGERAPERVRVSVTDDDGTEVFAGEVTLAGPPATRTGLIALHAPAPLAPGLHHARIELQGGSPGVTTTGFWVRDEALLTSGPRLSASRDWLRKDGAVLPIVGTTYMASDVHRKFLFEPNPHVWDADFAAMKAHGINVVRTGLWTAWGRAMLDPGAVDEGVLTALDAYVLTAAKHGLAVCFTFFAFLPPSFTGDNPYLDPRALEGQREILTLFASRYRDVGWIHWDLINEPSYAPPQWLWHTRPIGDPYERRAFAAWVDARHGADPLVVAERWRSVDVTEGGVEPPGHDEFGHHVIRESRQPRKVRDFREFTQDAVAAWARECRAVLRAAGGDALVTLGQDEGGTGDRPAPQMMFEALDYTAVHTWWNTDDLLWDGVVTKVPQRANVHQETGLMRLEDLDGWPWRPPETAALVLERKIACAFASRGAGVIEWAWNVNPYQPIDNESVIGLFRADGTAKPELDTIAEAAAFFRAAAPYLDDFEPDPVVLVIPHARLFLGRPGGIDATKVVVRLLAEHFGVVPTAISDLRLTARRLRHAKLVIVPSAEVLDEPAAAALLEACRRGARVLVTGALDTDSYGLPAPSLEALGLPGAGRPLAFHEDCRWSAAGRVRFEGLLVENVHRSLNPPLTSFESTVWHEPLPLELAREREPLVRLLGAALAAADVETHPSEAPIVARVLKAPRAALIVCVNETAADRVRSVTVDGVGIDVPVRAFGARMALVERGNARVIAATPGDGMKETP